MTNFLLYSFVIMELIQKSCISVFKNKGYILELNKKRIYLTSLVCGLCPRLVMEFWRYTHPVSRPVANFVIELFVFFIPVAIICLWVRYSKTLWGILRVIVTYVLLLFFVIYIGLLGNRHYKKHTVTTAISRPFLAIVQVEISIPEISEASIIWTLPEKDIIGCRIVLQKLKKGILQTQSGDNPLTIKNQVAQVNYHLNFPVLIKGWGFQMLTL